MNKEDYLSIIVDVICDNIHIIKKLKTSTADDYGHNFHTIKKLIKEAQIQLEEWKIDQVDRYYYASGRNHNTYVETTMWYEIHTLQRKETVRTETILYGSEWKLPDWAKGITTRRKSLESI